jgi:hypothetical protein
MEEHMATKAEYTPEEWQALQWAATDTMAYLSMADPGFWDTFKEATAAAKFVAAANTSGDNVLVRDLAADVKGKRDKDLTSNPTEMAARVVERVSAAVALVAEKDADDLPAFKAFILGLANATAAAVKGIGENEAGAIEKITAALG